MKILLLTNLYPDSTKDINVTHALHNFVKYWQNFGHEVIVIKPKIYGFRNLCKKNKVIENTINTIAVKIVPVYKYRRSLIFLNFEIRKLLKKNKFIPCVIIAHSSPSLLLSKKLAKSYKAKHIVGVHASNVINKSSIYNKVYHNADLLLCRSISIKKRLYSLYGIDERKIKLALSGINKRHILKVETLENKLDKWNHSKVTIFCTIARLIPLKNIDINLKALRNIPKDKWKYTIVGDGSEINKLESLVLEYGLENNVNIAGWKNHNEALEIMGSSHVFIMVSDPETFGLVYLEAMAQGCLIIGAKNCGIDGIVRNMESGYLCNPRDISDLEEVIKKILFANKEKRSNLVKKSFELACNMDELKMSKKYLEAIEILVTGS